MATQAKRVTDLPALTGPVANDVLLAVDDPDGSPSTRSVTVGELFGNSSVVVRANTLVLRTKSTPANSTPVVEQGTIWFDADYVYVAVANNVVKRASLASF